MGATNPEEADEGTIRKIRFIPRKKFCAWIRQS